MIASRIAARSGVYFKPFDFRKRRKTEQIGAIISLGSEGLKGISLSMLMVTVYGARELRDRKDGPAVDPCAAGMNP